MLKRVFDFVCALLGLILLSPLLLFVACAIRMSSPGPIIYRGLRIGLHGKPFYMLKFRTMRPKIAGDAEITVNLDPRVTRLGHILRITKIDELLQLVNVLRGEMSLVGPRPHSYQFIRHFLGDARPILDVRPGITGLVQLQFRHEVILFNGHTPEGFYVNVVLPFKQKIDLDYVRHHPFWRDLSILLLTVVVLVHPFPPPVFPMAAEQVAPGEERELAPVSVNPLQNSILH